MAEEPTPPERAEDLFADFLAQLQEGHDVHFEALCDERPELAEELRRLHDNWQQMWSMLGTPGGSFARRLEQTYGKDADPAIDLEAEVSERQETPASAMVKELASHMPSESRYRLVGEVARGGMGVILRV